MEKIRFTLLVSLCFLTSVAWTQQVVVSPLPQSILWGAKAFDNTTSFYLTGAATADKDAVALINSKLSIGKTGVEIVIGEKDAAAVAAYTAEIPQLKEGYFLKIEPGKVIVAGFDGSGTYYGVRSLIQILASPEVMSVTIKDFPSVSERGIIEGYYGNPFSHQARQRLFKFFGENKMNVYIYGPKDDAYHGFGNRWRDPYPAEQAARMKELIDVAHENKVNFIWAVHPGNNINWTDNDKDGIVDDFVACKNKFQKMYDLGVRSFAVFFDDIGGIGADPTNQAKMMNYLTTEFVNKKTDVSPLLLCPTQYNQAWSSGNYLDILGNEMDKSVRIMWTGKSVVRMIDKETMDWINARIKRNAYIWLNYPVTDYCIDHLLMGPTYGNSLNIASQLSGFTANPMEYAEASKVSLYSIGDYTWNMPKYNSNASWLRAMKYLMPDNYDAFKIFCENNIDLGSTFHGLRREGESAPFKTVADPFMKSYMAGTQTEQQITAVAEQFRSFINSSKELKATTTHPEMIEEITPWLSVFEHMGERGLIYLDMLKAYNEVDTIAFIDNYLKANELEIEQGKIRSRDFPGSIKNPYPKPGNEVVSPFLKQLKSKLITDYRNKYTYRTDVFPAVLIDNGTYFIKYNGKYLTNVRGSSSPTFVQDRDDKNPQRQEWKIAIDPSTERYSLINAEDNRYMNELGNFGTNPYEAVWHTYNLFRYSGKYAIQNGGSAGDKFWTSNDTRVSPSADNQLSAGNFLFELIPTAQDAVKHPIIVPAETYYIKNNGNYLTNTNPGKTGGDPAFRPLNLTDNVKTQQWIFTVDPTTDRLKLVNAADNRYVNEKGVFGTNAFIPSWNTYILTEMGGKFAVKTAGDAGNKYWNVSNLKVVTGDQGVADSYIFEIIPSGVITSVKKKVYPNEFYVIKKDNSIQLFGGEMKKMSLTNMQGVKIAEIKNTNVLKLNNLPNGTYILSALSDDGRKKTFKLIMP